MEILLSICIPTYNRGKYIAELFESIKCHDIGKIQIVVSDNASTDDTADVISQYKGRFKNFEYHKNEENLGFDKNVMAVTSHAKGKFSIIMGSDDVFPEGALDKILNFIDLDKDVILFNRIETDISLKPIRYSRYSDYEEGTVIEFSGEDSIVEYCTHCRDITALFSFLSCVVVRTSLWKSVVPESSFFGTGYIHVGMHFSEIHCGCTLVYAQEHLVMARGGNDGGFYDLAKRFFYDVDGYGVLVNAVFGDMPKAREAILRVLAASHYDRIRNLKKIIWCKCYMSRKDWNRYCNWLNSHTSLELKFRLMNYVTPVQFVPRRVINWVIRAYYNVKNKRHPGQVRLVAPD